MKVILTLKGLKVESKNEYIFILAEKKEIVTSYYVIGKILLRYIHNSRISYCGNS